eukprot:scaffold18301_cov48-Attheya_sp.AAC.1
MLPFVGWVSLVGVLLVGLLVVDGVEGFSILGIRRSSSMTMKMTQEPDNNRMDNSSNKSSSSIEALDRRRWIQSAAGGAAFVAASSGIMTGNPPPSNAAYIDINTDKPKITQTVYLDVQIMDTDNKEPTRIMIGLFGDVMPKTVENFVALCVGGNRNDNEDNQGNDNITRGYAGTTFYRVLSGITVQGGAIGPNTRNGKTGLSSFGENGEPFEPDNYNIQHSHADGLVCMVRGLGGSVDSRFFIHTNANGGWADDRYAAFGMVLNQNGMDYIHNKMEKVPVKPPSNIPMTPIQIVASGILPDK